MCQGKLLEEVRFSALKVVARKPAASVGQAIPLEEFFAFLSVIQEVYFCLVFGA
jgi:hypothetical protein